jgi:hypothetical protein
MPPRKLIASLLAWTLLASLPTDSPAVAEPSRKWDPQIDPLHFVSAVDNPYFPLVPGQKYRYANPLSDETVLIAVTMRGRLVMGVRTTVVVETVKDRGETLKVSESWYAQDREGNVWCFGEKSEEYENGLPVSTSGSWEAGVSGAVPGIVMKARPVPGATYFLEVAPGVAEAMARVESVTWSEVTPKGTFSGVVKTREWSPLEGGGVEFKYYAPGVGLILEEEGGSRMELVAIE